jgi:hypothetical protein
MKCKRAIVYYSRGKPIAYTLLYDGERPTVPEGLKVVETKFVKAYVRFPSIQGSWNADGTPRDKSTSARVTSH